MRALLAPACSAHSDDTLRALHRPCNPIGVDQGNLERVTGARHFLPPDALLKCHSHRLSHHYASKQGQPRVLSAIPRPKNTLDPNEHPRSHPDLPRYDQAARMRLQPKTVASVSQPLDRFTTFREEDGVLLSDRKNGKCNTQTHTPRALACCDGCMVASLAPVVPFRVSHHSTPFFLYWAHERMRDELVR